MNRPIRQQLMRQLIAKEFFLYRWMLAGATAGGLAGLAIAAMGEIGFNIGFIVWITAVIALGVMLALFGVATERKERSLLFLLSLPLSPGDHVKAKLIGLFACFLAPWAVMSGGALALIKAMPGIPDGLLPFAVLLCVYLLLNFAAVLSAVLHIHSEAAMGGVIIVTNMSVSLVMTGLGRLPGIGAHMQQPVPAWNATFWLALAAEVAALLLVLSLPLLFAARRRDFI
jgi:ABC-2 type transport system permease protein